MFAVITEQQFQLRVSQLYQNNPVKWLALLVDKGTYSHQEHFEQLAKQIGNYRAQVMVFNHTGDGDIDFPMEPQTYEE